MSDDYIPIFGCPVEGCSASVVDWLGELWDCGYHGVGMVWLPNQGPKLLAPIQQRGGEE